MPELKKYFTIKELAAFLKKKHGKFFTNDYLYKSMNPKDRRYMKNKTIVKAAKELAKRKKRLIYS